MNIIVKRVENSFEIFDKNDECMKTCIASYQIKESAQKKLYIALYLNKLTADVKFQDEAGIEVTEQKLNKQVCAIVCATESVLKHLDKAGCVGCSQIKLTIKLVNEQLATIDLDNGITDQKGIISHAFAEALHAEKTERKIALYLNDRSEETVQKINNVLVQLFPVYQPENPL